MRPRIVMGVLAVFIVAGIIAGVLYLKNQNSGQQAATESTPQASEAAPPPVEATTTDTSASTQPIGERTSNPNPDLTVDGSGLSKATVWMETSRGLVKFKFYSEDAPNTVKRMVELINKGFYNGLTFHRVVPSFVVQGGDPDGNGTGGSGQKLKAEFNKRHHVEGSVAMARAADPDSADSQFYIALAPQPHLDGSYTVFGQVIEGMDAVRKLQIGDKMDKLIIE